MHTTHSARRRRERGAALLGAIIALTAGCSSDTVDTTATTTESSAPSATAPATATSENTAAPTSDPSQDTDTDAGAAAENTAATDGGTAEPDPSVDTTYFDLFVNQGVLYDPFYPDALGGDIVFFEPECNRAASDLASFGAARSSVDAASVLASLEAVGGDVPSNFPAALDAWQAFIADSSDTYNGPFVPTRDGVRDDATVRQVLTDPNVVEMLDTYTSLELKAPNDFIGYLAGACTFAEQGVDVTTGD